MTDLEKYSKFVLSWEGKFGKSLEDSASKKFCPTPYKGVKYHTSHGITYTTWSNAYGTSKDKEFFEMPTQMWWEIFKKRFYDKIKGDEFKTKPIAYLVTEIAWMSGVSEGGEHLQKALCNIGIKVTIDGVIGQKTIQATNSADQKELFAELVEVRKKFYIAISTGKNAKWLNGWMNRLNKFVKTFPL
jgi:lysozyme family protein